MSEKEIIELERIKKLLPVEDAEKLQAIVDRHDNGWGFALKKLRNYECGYGYRLDSACVSGNCDVVNHRKERL